jgi:hypothetical protein
VPALAPAPRRGLLPAEVCYHVLAVGHTIVFRRAEAVEGLEDHRWACGV